MPLLKLSEGRLSPALEEALVEVSLEAWTADPDAHAEATALAISNDARLDALAGRDAAALNRFDVVILDFPTFKDGRAYSQARLLRERFGYAGELRARGHVLRDQILFMARCGFDAFDFHGNDIGGLEEALREFSFVYQAAADAAEPVWRRRLKIAAAA